MLWIATIAGAGLGVFVACIANWLSGRLGGGDFWKSLPELTRALATQADSDAFLKLYGKLLRLLGAYLFRNAVQLAVSFAPVIATVILAGPAVMEAYNRGATELSVHPPRSLNLETDAGGQATNDSGSAFIPVPDFAGTRVATTETGTFPVANPRQNQAWCLTDWGRLGMGLLGFETHVATEATGYLVLRPKRSDWNPLWPYLNDLEFLLYLGIALASGATALILKAKKQ